MSEKQTESSGPAVTAEDQIRLKPFLGLRPGIYLTIIYSLIFVMILFFILIYPGLKRPGAVIALKTEPVGAALRVDGVYRGTAPDKIFVSRGRHTLEIVLPGFNTERIECEIPGRIFASAFFPRRYPLEVKLESPDPAAVFAAAAADYAAWTFGGEPTASWQIPLSLSEGAYRAGGQSAVDKETIEELLKASARFAVTRAALRDLVRAKTIADNGGLSPSPLSLVNSAADVIRFLSENPGSAAWLAEVLSPETAALITASSWYQKQPAPSAAVNSGKALPAKQLVTEGLEFIDTGGGFMISAAEVPAPTFAAFLAANPQWRADQREALVKEGLVTGDYLVEDRSETGVTAVSWFAAQACCAWLNARLPPSLAGYEIRLPTEAEWEYAVKSPGAALTGSSWEWCADPYAPLDFLAAAPEAAAAVGSPERSVRGGSWVSGPGPAGPETRASLPPAFCSPFVSFRPVIAPKPGLVR
jgi:hypothetical protein